MPIISFTLSPAAIAEFIDAMCFLYQYPAMVGDEPNPETRATFARRMLVAHMKERVNEYRIQRAVLAAKGADADIT